MSNYYSAYKFLKPLAKVAGQKTVKQVKATAKKAKDSFEKFEVDQKYKASKEKLFKTIDYTKKNLDKAISKTKENVKLAKETLKGFKKGGRIGFKKGTGRSGVPAMDIKSTPTKKLSEKQKKIARLAGDPQKIDKPDFAKLRNKNKKKVI